MSVISAITPTSRHPGRFDLWVDGDRYATMSLEAIERLQLSVGRNVDGFEERISAEAAQLKVYDRALNMLAFRARASTELARALVRKGELREYVDVAVARLQEQGLLDDSAFARAYTRAKILGARQSRRRVQQDLGRKGVARDVSAAAIDAVFDEEGVDQSVMVEEAARRKLRTLIKLDPVVRRRRLYGFLARRGYEADDIRAAMKAVDEEKRGEEGSGIRN